MVLLFQRNDVLNDETDEVDIDKLRAQGKAVMRIVGDVDLVNQTNNKKVRGAGRRFTLFALR